MAEIKPAYLIAGSDDAKVGATVTRLRQRALREGGEGALESFSSADGPGAPDAEGVIAAIPALSLLGGRRYLLAEHVERWNAKQAGAVAEALDELPPETTVVLVAHEEPPRVKAPKALAAAVEKAGGAVLSYDSPGARELPRWLAAEAEKRGIAIEPQAARLLADRMGSGTVRLTNELDRLALWAGEGGSVSAEDLEAMVADTSEAMVWSLSDAVVERRPGLAVELAERLTGQSESVAGLVYAVAGRLRKAHKAASELEAGRPPKDVQAGLKMSPYAAKMVVKSVRSTTPAELRAASCALADLEWWSRGGAEYPEQVALTVAIRRAAGGG